MTDSGADRAVVVHLHLFKNAGTSVKSALGRYFGERMAEFDVPPPGAKHLFAPELLELLDARPEVAAVSSHQLRPPLPDRPDIAVVPVVFIRHPLDRIRSAYEFDRRRPGHPSAHLAEGADFSQWIDFLLEKRSRSASNFHVRSLTTAWDLEGGHIAPLGAEEHLTRACRFLDGLPAVGIVERFDESWKEVAETIRAHFPDFDMVPGAENIGEDRAEDLEGRLADMERELGPERYARLKAKNDLDLRLYAHAVSGLGRRR